MDAVVAVTVIGVLLFALDVSMLRESDGTSVMVMVWGMG